MAEFSSQLLDGYDLLYKRNEETLKSTQEFSNFFRKLSAIESNYAKELQKLAQTVTSKKASAELGTVKDAWESIHAELESVGNKHQQLGVQLQNDLATPIAAFVKEKDNIRKKLLADGTKQSTDMKNTLRNLDKTKGNYVNLCKAADKAQQDFQKAKTEGGNVKPKEINRLQSKSSKATDAAVSADKEYQQTLQKANERQKTFYTSEMPSLLREFQAFEEDRIQFLKTNLQKFASFYNEFPPFVEKVAKSIERSANNVDVGQDIKTFVDQNKTGVTPPADMQFEKYTSDTNFDLGTGAGPSVNRGSASVTSSGGGSQQFSRSASGSSTPAPAAVEATRSAIVVDDSLSASDKAAKLNDQLSQLKDSIKAEQKSKKGLEKLVKFYQSDPQAQEKARGELEEQKRKIAGLKEQKMQLEAALTEVSGVGSSAVAASSPMESTMPSKVEDTNNDPVYEEGAVLDDQPTAKARALYDYEATNDTELSFPEGAILTITEQDESGWWFAELNGSVGFIPNNYVELV